jgi:hypothetical protein
MIGLLAFVVFAFGVLGYCVGGWAGATIGAAFAALICLGD